MPDSTVDIALSLRGAEWFPNCVDYMLLHSDFAQPILERIAWAAAVALWDAGWICIAKQNVIVPEYGWGHPETSTYRSDPDPIRATLLAARELERSRHD